MLKPVPPSSGFSPHTRGCSCRRAYHRLFQHVFPAYAGMFRSTLPPSKSCNSFPRIRGDVPSDGHITLVRRRFSPHTRGCSRPNRRRGHQKAVFPAYAGMFRHSLAPNTPNASFPRIRGDVPKLLKTADDLREFSPHTRGCSANPQHCPRSLSVFPAYAGMFLIAQLVEPLSTSFPRIRGDVPDALSSSGYLCGFSPHTRGCSFGENLWLLRERVFPAYAGMFRSSRSRPDPRQRFPRIRGDVPIRLCVRVTGCRFSPHTRGCSPPPLAPQSAQQVFPAYAGMFPPQPSPTSNELSFPRIRGDVPGHLPMPTRFRRFSPHTRGCS